MNYFKTAGKTALFTVLIAICAAISIGVVACDDGSGNGNGNGNQTAAGTYLSVTLFNHNVESISPVGRLEQFFRLMPGSSSEIRRLLERVEFGGQTALFTATQVSTEKFVTQRASYPTDAGRRIQVIFTDGLSTSDATPVPTEVRDLYSEEGGNAIESFALGIRGRDVTDAALPLYTAGLRAVATSDAHVYGGGSAGIDDLSSLFDEISGEITSVSTQSITLSTPPFFRGARFLRWTFDSATDPEDSTAYIEAEFTRTAGDTYRIRNVSSETLVLNNTRDVDGVFSDATGLVSFTLSSVSETPRSGMVQLYSRVSVEDPWVRTSEATSGIERVTTTVAPTNAVSLVIDVSGSLSGQKAAVIDAVISFIERIAVPAAPPAAAPERSAITWTRRASNTTNSINDIHYANSLWVAVGDGGTITTSPDGIIWTRRGSGITNPINDIHYTNSLWVAVAGGGSILTSPDGIAWTRRTSNITSALFDIHYANSLWVAAGDNGAITTSSDGLTWAPRVSNTGNPINAIHYANSLWVAVGGGDGAIITSSDGITWRMRTGSFGGIDIHYANSLWVAAAADGTIATSSDGIMMWTRRTSSITSALIDDIHYANSLWVAVGGGGAITTSSGGLTWTPQASGTTSDIFDIHYANSLWVAGTGDSGGRILTSSDGTTWTERATGIASTIFDIHYANSLWVAAGSNGAIITAP